ncbi:MAG: ArsR/SmtB family transcription factor [Flavobacteriaceae bacterium]
MILERAATQLEALGNPTRLDIYRLLVRAGEDGLSVGRIQQRVGIPGSTLSHHCKCLAAAGLITRERRGTSLICRADYTSMNALVGFLADECCADAQPARADD